MAPQAPRIFCQSLWQQTPLSPRPVPKRLKITGCFLAETVGSNGGETDKNCWIQTEEECRGLIRFGLEEQSWHWCDGIRRLSPRQRSAMD